MKNLALVFERLTFTKIIALWLAIVLSFSIIYFGLTYTDQHLIYDGRPLSNDASGFGNAVYFSFITSTTIGYGDIAPTGFAKVLAIIEAIASITLFGAFIGKIVSVKQEEILEEIQELSLEEATSSTISGLYIFRSHAKELKERLDSKEKLKPKDLAETENALSNLKSALGNFNIAKIVANEEKEKSLMRIELMSNSINFSLSRFVELLESINKHKTDWKKESIAPTIAECSRTTATLYVQYNLVKSDDELSRKVGEKLEDLNKTLAALQKSLQ